MVALRSGIGFPSNLFLLRGHWLYKEAMPREIRELNRILCSTV